MSAAVGLEMLFLSGTARSPLDFTSPRSCAASYSSERRRFGVPIVERQRLEKNPVGCTFVVDADVLSD
jgi:hypothetical protein